ncbi:lipoate-protein ligase A [Strigomonas culicis]|nr:lipoate-protein ligase A [Strigomonas culicis]|eukprot:EPY25736.1 lipoate-protein ligase A [Strigomonas culicis]
MALCGIEGSRLGTTGRHDLFLDGRKITGSAMRVTGSIAFHHCTLLVSSDLPHLGRYLKPEGDFTHFETTSVDSVRSPVTTLQSTGVWPPPPTAPGEAAGDLEHAMTRFFHHCAPLILSHDAPQALPVDALRDVWRDGGERAGVALDVAGASDSRVNMPFLYGEGRRHQRGDALTVAEDIARMQSRSWLFNMPVFTATVRVSAGEWLSRIRLLTEADAAAYEEVLSSLLGGAAEVELTTRVTRRKVDRVSASLPWLENLFTAFVTGGPCDAVVPGLVASESATDGILDGLRMECRPLLDLGAAPGADDACDQILCTVWRAVVELWRAKNVFDI